MRELKADMAFEIGDIVYFKSAQHRLSVVPNPFIVVERFVQECHGGIQRLYKLGENRETYPEIALTKTMPPRDMAFEQQRIDEEKQLSELRYGKEALPWFRMKEESK